LKTENDVYFIDNDIIDSLISAAKRLEFKENPDSIVYYCGTLKNFSENSKLLKQLSVKNLEETLAKIIKDLSKFVRQHNEEKKS
jgi:hypothetical protein